MHDPVNLTLDGFRYCYRKCGNWDGRTVPIFFVSGAFQSMTSWRKFERYFCRQGAPVLLADLPGTGQADVLPDEYGIDFLADAAAQVISHSRAEYVHLASASYGTPISFRCAQRNPSRVASLVLAGTMKEIPSHVRPAIIQNLKTLASGDMHQFASEGIEGGFLCRDVKKTIDRRELSERVLYHSMSEMSPHAKRQYKANTRRLLRQRSLDLRTTHQIRSLVFTGEHDTFTTPEFCREVARSLHDCWFTTIHRADHLFHIQQFHTTAQLIDRFINNRPLEVEGIEKPEYVGKTALKFLCPQYKSRNPSHEPIGGAQLTSL